GSNERIPTQLYNGYGEQVAYLYEGMDPEELFF
ncbi:MAG: protein-methionine-sulfoxide reductase catalytic subunit MsrP, partial [Rhodospirillaceae bacterium]|nr:protein-methionine-sulfoxide reductase catalytic subunit MsrP [Rhodospirillaceae bacterium]